jgi:hypothetical protein
LLQDPADRQCVPDHFKVVGIFLAADKGRSHRQGFRVHQKMLRALGLGLPLIEMLSRIAVLKMDSGARPVFFAIAFNP